jgi:hypothetical protein
MVFKDKFGHDQIYKGLAGRRVYEIPSDDLDDDNYKVGNSTSGNNDDGYRCDSNGQVRINFLTQDRYDGDGATQNLGTAKQRGYLWKNTDWRNAEFTVYLRPLNSSGGDTDIPLGLRGGRHTDGQECEGATCKVAVDIDSGEARFRKEQRHPNDYISRDWEDIGLGGNWEDDWIGFKFCLYNRESNDEDATVVWELWVDDDDDGTFSKEMTYTERPDSWGDGNYCSGGRNTAISWGGPYALLRWDGPTVEFRDVVVRELSFPISTDTSGEGGSEEPEPELPPGPGTPNTPTQPTGPIVRRKFWDVVYSINSDTGETCGITGSPGNNPVETPFYNVSPTNNYFEMYAALLRRVGLFINSSSSENVNRRVREVKATLKKIGSPTGNVYCRVYDEKEPTDNLIAEIGLVDSATLLTTDSSITFTNLASEALLKTGYKLYIVYEGGDVNNKVQLKVANLDPVDGSRTCIKRKFADGSTDIQTRFDFAGSIAS